MEFLYIWLPLDKPAVAPSLEEILPTPMAVLREVKEQLSMCSVDGCKQSEHNFQEWRHL